jgi:hypothetical protein
MKLIRTYSILSYTLLSFSISIFTNRAIYNLHDFNCRNNLHVRAYVCPVLCRDRIFAFVKAAMFIREVLKIMMPPLPTTDQTAYVKDIIELLNVLPNIMYILIDLFHYWLICISDLMIAIGKDFSSE